MKRATVISAKDTETSTEELPTETARLLSPSRTSSGKSIKNVFIQFLVWFFVINCEFR